MNFPKEVMEAAGYQPTPENIVQTYDFNKKMFSLVPATSLTEKQTFSHWQIKDILEINNLGHLFGEPAGGKTLIALDMAFCVATGTDWHGHKVKQSQVVYLAGEGFGGLSRRFKGLEKKYDIKADNLFISQTPAALTEYRSAQAVKNSIDVICPGAELIIIDTLNRNFGGDENSTKDMTIFVQNIDLYLRSNNATVLVVHHSGHGNKDRSRGASSLHAAVDVEYKINKTDNIVTMSNTKAKDIEPPQPIAFKINSTEIDWKDEEGNFINVPTIEQTEYIEQKKTLKINHKEQMLLKALRESTEVHGIDATSEMKGKFGGLKEKKVIYSATWRKTAYPLLPFNGDDNDRKKMMAAKLQAFNRCRDKLLNEGKIAGYGDYYWEIL
ncbi:MAG: helicase RepA family protein [gamma proteobacterium symbiont of Taylorina sp.]|nr:helicase RepA family protein [gamma proteobacterium symbiont of Taylorina sp.]